MSMKVSDHYRGVIHIHSTYSFDSITEIDTIIAFAQRENLDFVILTDHDTTCGSQALCERGRELGLDIIIPLAAEYHTSHGDIIAVFLVREIVEKEFSVFVEDALTQNALLLLPHPYVGHNDLETMASRADMIEVFNGRVSTEHNMSAELLAMQFKKPVYYASDAHLSSSLANTIISVERKGDLRESLLTGTIRAEKMLPLARADITVSQIIKSIKTRDWKLFILSIIRIFGYK